MEQGCIYTDKAYEWLKNICNTRIYDRYRENTSTAYSRMEKELIYIEKQGSAPLFREAFEALRAVGAKSGDYYPMGALASSIVSYLLDFSDIDPLNSDLRLYSEFCYGLEGERVPEIELRVTPDIYRGLIRYFDSYSGDAHLLYRHFTDGMLFGVRILDPQIKKIPDRDNDLRFSFLKIRTGKKHKRNITKGKVFDRVNPQTFSEQVRCLGLSHNAKWAWKKNAKQLYTSGEIAFDQLIAHREDIYEYMMDHGIDKEYAYKIAEYVRKGRAHRNGWNPELLEVMLKAKIPLWYMESCSKINYLFPRVHDMILVKRFCK